MAKEKTADASREETIEKLKNLTEAAAAEKAEEAASETETTETAEEVAEAVSEETDTGADEAEHSDDAEAADGEAPEAESEDTAEKKSLFGKDKKKDKLKEQLAELNDKLMRQMAEFENFRKRTDKEKDAMFETGARSVIEKLLPVVDNFERGITALTEEESATPFADGMQRVYKQLIDELTKLEVKPIEALGQEFDPNLHNAVMHVDDEEVGDNIVVEELQKGYTYRDTVVRHSMVKVAN